MWPCLCLSQQGRRLRMHLIMALSPPGVGQELEGSVDAHERHHTSRAAADQLG